MKLVTLGSIAGVLQVAVACHPASPAPIQHGPGTYRDSVSETSAMLYHLVRATDAYGRTSGALPSTLERVYSPHQMIGARDIWEQEWAYDHHGLSFEVRSPGRDGMLRTVDDIVATGRLGRDLPCELRNEFSSLRYEDVAPLCADTPIRVLPPCPAADTISFSLDQAFGSTREDSIQAAAQHVTRVSRRIDAIGRGMGGLPPAPLAVNPEVLADPWKRTLRYTRTGERFEVRSAGPDGNWGTADDIFVRAELGRPHPCASTSESGTIYCADLVPPCP